MSKKGDRKVMKKIRLLIASIVCALMLMGVGYAAWNQSIHVKASAQAGQLNVRLVNGQSEGAWKIIDKDGIANWAIAGNDGKTLTLKFDRLYPGAKATLEGSVVNNGNLPARFSDFIVSDIKGKSSDALKYPLLYRNLQASLDGTNFVSLDIFFNELRIPEIKIAANTSQPVPPIYFRLAPEAPSSIQGADLTFSVEFVFELDVNTLQVKPQEGQK
jgi:hypothetical protein